MSKNIELSEKPRRKSKSIYPDEFWDVPDSTNRKILNNNNDILSPTNPTQLNTDGDYFLSDTKKKVRLLDGQNDYSNNLDSKKKKQNESSQFSKLENEDKEESLENGRVTKFYFNRLMNFEYTLLFFALTEIVFGFIYYDNDFMESTNDERANKNAKLITKCCLYLIFISSLIQVLITYLRYLALLDFEKKQLVVDKRDNIKTTGKLRSFLLEVCIIMTQPYPFLNDIQIKTYNYYDDLSFEFKLNWLLALLGLLRIFIILRVMLKNTLFLNPRAQRLCRMYGCTANYQFAIKCLFQDYPMTLITVVFLLSVAVFAFAIRICERPINILLGDENGMDFESIENSLWMVIITMTTVGYGDFYPRTFFGRILDIIIAIWGIFIVSMMVVVLSSTLELDSSEQRALKVLQRLKVRKELRQKAAYLLTGIATYNFLERKKRRAGQLELTPEYLIKKSIKIKKYTDEFRTVNRRIKNLYDKDNLYEELTRQFDFIRDDIKNLNDQQEKLCVYLEENFNIGNGKTLQE